MFKVLYAPFQDIKFERFCPSKGTPAVLAYVRDRGARVFISVEEGKEKTEVPMIKAAAGFLNCSPSFEFTWLTLHSIKDTWRADLKPGEKESKFSRTVRFMTRFGRNRQPPFAPNNGSRPDGIW
jgi:hypothetical protein